MEFTESAETEDFKLKVCLPYFKDIFIDLVGRSDNKQKGINKITFVEYTLLPGLLAERFFHVLDVDKDEYLSQKEFLTGLLRLYCSKFNQKINLVFEIYDFDGDGLISKKDILTLLTSMPTVRLSTNKAGEANPLVKEGKYTQEGGGAMHFEERVSSLE